MQQLAPDAGSPVELRVLTGPNLYFPRPAVKLTLDAEGVLGAEPAAVVAWQRALRVRNPTVGLPHSPTRALAAAELAAAVVAPGGRHAAHPGGRGRPTRRRRHRGGRLPVPAPRHRGAVRARRRPGVRARSPPHGVDPVAALGEIPAALAGHDPGETVRPLRPGDPGGRGDRDQRQDDDHPADRAPGQGRRPDPRLVVDRRHLHRRRGGGDRRLVRVPAARPGCWRIRRVQVAVTETARGGILLRGVGTAVNDVSVVTNISADHLGLLGVHTVEQLAEVKSVVVRITKPKRLDRAERRRSAGQGDAVGVAGAAVVLLARPGQPLPGRGTGGRRPGDHRGRRPDRHPRPRARPDGGDRRGRRPADPGRRVQGERLQRARRDRGGDRGRGAAGRRPQPGWRSFTAGAEHNAGRLNVYRLDIDRGAAGSGAQRGVAGIAAGGRRTRCGCPAASSRWCSAPPATAPTRRSTRWARWPRRRRTGWWWPTGSSTSAAGSPARWKEIWRAGAAEAGVVQVDESPDELSGLIHLLDEASPPLPRRVRGRGVRAGAARGDGRGDRAPRRRRDDAGRGRRTGAAAGPTAEPPGRTAPSRPATGQRRPADVSGTSRHQRNGRLGRRPAAACRARRRRGRRPRSTAGRSAGGSNRP